MVSAVLAEARVPGASVAVLDQGRVKWAAGFGVRSSGDSEPVDSQTVFAAASLSKPPFAFLVLKLADHGVLDLDTPLARLDPRPYDAYGLDSADERLRQITARQVLSHTSGLGNWAPEDIGRVSFDPGARWHYSGEGYLYLQRTVESLTQQPLHRLCEEQVLRPLGLQLSSWVWRDDWANFATGHGTSSTGGNRFPEAFSAFSLHATAGEYAQMVVAMMGDGCAAEMFEPEIAIDGALAWGLGFGLTRKMFWQWGDSGDFQSVVVGSRGEQRAFVCLTNSELGLEACAEIAARLMGDEYATPIREVIRRGW
jgi:CubicO group peptidase (beta-lactamase class C family)